jgi:hypothetical protein
MKNEREYRRQESKNRRLLAQLAAVRMHLSVQAKRLSGIQCQLQTTAQLIDQVIAANDEKENGT